ncbi:MAG: 50S ribosomal protein L4 [Saprospiraceae bacterium]
MKLDVIGVNGKSTGKSVELPEAIFGAEPNEHVVYLAVKQYLANQRQGTHKSKERGEIAGSTRKIKRQKGTGTARAGSLKNPMYRSGGRMFGPRPRNYNTKLNKKVKRLARISALSDKMKNQNLIVVENFGFDSPKTKEYRNILSNLGLDAKKTLLVTPNYDNTLYLSCRNLPDADTQAAKDLHTYQILNANTLIISEDSLNVIKETLA